MSMQRLGALALVAVLAVACGETTYQRAVPVPTTTTAPTVTTSSITTTTAAPTTTTTTTGTAPTPPAGPMGVGAVGDDVLSVEQRLQALGYWPGAVDGTFDADTKHAVVALQKSAHVARDGSVGPATLQALDAGVLPTPRSTAGTTLEINREDQVLVIVQDGTVRAVFDTSTGAAGRRTPTGHWWITRQIDGYHRSRLGLLYRPKYFHLGYAIHGFTSVPPYPASHGCVRVTYHAIDHIWSAGLAPVGTPVWIY